MAGNEPSLCLPVQDSDAVGLNVIIFCNNIIDLDLNTSCGRSSSPIY